MPFIQQTILRNTFNKTREHQYEKFTRDQIPVYEPEGPGEQGGKKRAQAQH